MTNNNKVEYVYLMADYKLNQRAKEQTKAFIHGFRTVISEGWIKLFSPPELQRVLSGEDTDFGNPCTKSRYKSELIVFSFCRYL